MKLASIFSSHMVFAHSEPIRVFGTGTGNAQITFAGVTQTVNSDGENWMVEFSPMGCGGPYTLTFCADGGVVTLDDIFVGKVFFFSGQSNMAFLTKSAEDGLSYCESNDKLRLFSPDRSFGDDYFKAADGWVLAEKSTVSEWSALAFFAGNLLAKEKDVAVGIVVSYQGGSVIESWVPEGLFEKNGIDIPMKTKGAGHYEGEFATFNGDGVLYNDMLSQVIPFALSAVVWYQGESDTFGEEAKIYGKELSLLIDKWREDFISFELPFVIVQIADYDVRKDEFWKTVQQAQYDIQFTKQKVTTVISADVCQSDDIHPTKKYALAQRIAKALSDI